MVSKGRKTAAYVARLFKVHPATVSRLLARAYAKSRAKILRQIICEVTEKQGPVVHSIIGNYNQDYPTKRR
jgi:hypothetical protein